MRSARAASRLRAQPKVQAECPRPARCLSLAGSSDALHTLTSSSPLALLGTLARFDREPVRRVAVVRINVVVAAAKRHDARRRARERAGVLELLRDDERVLVREAEPLEQTHVLRVIDAVVEQ